MLEGRLPAGIGVGALLRISRLEAGLAADFLGPVGIYPCEGARSEEHSALLEKYMAEGIGAFAALHSLRRDPHPADDDCWLHTREVCLSKIALH